MRYELTEFEWAARSSERAAWRVDDRRVLNGIFWVLRFLSPRNSAPRIFISASRVTRPVIGRAMRNTIGMTVMCQHVMCQQQNTPARALKRPHC